MSERSSLEKSMSLASVIICALIIFIVIMGFSFSQNLPANIRNSSGGASTPPSSSSNSSPAPSGGGSSSGKGGVNIPAWIMPIGIAYLIIKGLLIIGRNYITIFDWVIIAILAFFAILSFWNGKNRWLSLVLIVAIGCIIWFNQAHIDSFKPKTPTTEQSADQPQQVAPAPVEETPSTERVVVAGRKITLTGDGTYTIPAGRKSLCFTALGKTDGSEITDQTINIIYKDEKFEYKTLGSKCFILPDRIEGIIKVDFFPEKSWGEEPVLSNMYKRYSAMSQGQGEWPVIRIGE